MLYSFLKSLITFIYIAIESMNKVGWKWLGYLVWAFHHQIGLQHLRGLVQKRPKQTEEINPTSKASNSWPGFVVAVIFTSHTFTVTSVGVVCGGWALFVSPCLAIPATLSHDVNKGTYRRCMWPIISFENVVDRWTSITKLPLAMLLWYGSRNPKVSRAMYVCFN